MEELMEEAEDANLQQDVGMDSEVAKNEEERSNREQSREEYGGEVCVKQIEAAIQLGQVTFIEDINIRSKLEAEKEEPFTSVLPPSAVEDDLANQRTMVSCTKEQQSILVYVPVEVSQQAGPSSRTEYGMEVRGDDNGVEAISMELPDSFVAPDDSSMTTMLVTCQHTPGRDNDTSQTVSRNAYKQDPYVQELCISISNRLANVEARTLPLSRLKYHDTSWEECIPSIGQRNMMHKKMVNGGMVKHCACVNFSRYVTVDITHQSYNELTLMCRTLGMMCGIKSVLTIQGVKPGQREDANPRAIFLECDQPLSDMEVEVLNEDGVPDESEEISNATNSTDKYKKTVVGHATIPNDCAVKNEFQDNHALIGDNKDSRRCGLLKMGRCEFATDDDEMDPNGITETPTNGFGVSVWRAVHDLTLISLAIFVVIFSKVGTITRSWKEECAGRISVKQKTEPRCTDQTMDPRTRQTDAFDLWMEEGCWIYMTQGANGHMWGKSCRDLQIHHDQPD